MSVSQPHTYAGEACGFLTWLWVFYRAKHDLPVVLGLRHPWEHAEDPWAIVDHVENLHALEEDWEDFAVRSTNPGEVRRRGGGRGGGERRRRFVGICVLGGLLFAKGNQVSR